MIALTLEPTTSARLKVVLRRWRPDITSSHRSQALARGAGFRTHEALRAALDCSEIIAPHPAYFATFLDSRGYEADANLIHRIFASVAIEAVATRYPRLTSLGFGLGTTYPRESPAVRRAQFAKYRNELFGADFAEAFLRSHALIGRIPKTKTVRPDAHSYRLKHIAENLVCAYPDGSHLGPAYVPNGAFIAAAAHNGFIVDRWRRSDGTEQLNADFNMPKGVVDDLDAECRPDGAIGSLRQERQRDRDRQARVRAVDAACRAEWRDQRIRRARL